MRGMQTPGKLSLYNQRFFERLQKFQLTQWPFGSVFLLLKIARSSPRLIPITKTMRGRGKKPPMRTSPSKTILVRQDSAVNFEI